MFLRDDVASLHLTQLPHISLFIILKTREHKGLNQDLQNVRLYTVTFFASPQTLLISIGGEMLVSEVFVCEGKIQTRGPLGGYSSVHTRLKERVPFQALSELSANNYYRRIAQGEKK